MQIDSDASGTNHEYSNVLQQPSLPTNPLGLLNLPGELVPCEPRLELSRRLKKLLVNVHYLDRPLLDLHLVRFSQLRPGDKQYDVLHGRSAEQAANRYIWLDLLRRTGDTTKCERNLRRLCEWSRIYNIEGLAEKE